MLPKVAYIFLYKRQRTLDEASRNETLKRLTPDYEALLAEAFLDVVFVAVILDLPANREVLRRATKNDSKPPKNDKIVRKRIQYVT